MTGRPSTMEEAAVDPNRSPCAPQRKPSLVGPRRPRTRHGEQIDDDQGMWRVTNPMGTRAPV